MITNEQIAELIANYEAPAHIWKDDVVFAREYAFEFARSVVAMAQQVKIAKIEALEADVDLIEPPQYYVGFEECKALILAILRGGDGTNS